MNASFVPMVAGAVGIDAVVLVVAADEGVMPQTREHLDICELLGVQSGVVALTKCDLVTDDLLALAKQELRQVLAGTFSPTPTLSRVRRTAGVGLSDSSQAIERIAAQTAWSRYGIGGDCRWIASLRSKGLANSLDRNPVVGNAQAGRRAGGTTKRKNRGKVRGLYACMAKQFLNPKRDKALRSISAFRSPRLREKRWFRPCCARRFIGTGCKAPDICRLHGWPCRGRSTAGACREPRRGSAM